MKIAIIGSGISAVIVAKTFLEHNYKVHLIDSENVLDRKKLKKNNKINLYLKLKNLLNITINI